MSDIPKHHRRSIRLKSYDYSQTGGYFVTICAHNHKCLFGKIKNHELILNGYGKIVEEEWFRSSEIRKEIELDAFIVMPNHIHGIVIINKTSENNIVGAKGPSPLRMKSKSISSFISGFKSIVTKRINILRNMPQSPIWQRNYYEHIIRDDDDLNKIREYITCNYLKWEEDEENPNNKME